MSAEQLFLNREVYRSTGVGAPRGVGERASRGGGAEGHAGCRCPRARAGRYSYATTCNLQNLVALKLLRIYFNITNRDRSV